MHISLYFLSAPLPPPAPQITLDVTSYPQSEPRGNYISVWSDDGDVFENYRVFTFNYLQWEKHILYTNTNTPQTGQTVSLPSY